MMKGLARAAQGFVGVVTKVTERPAGRYQVERNGEWTDADEPPIDGARWFSTEAFDGIHGGSHAEG